MMATRNHAICRHLSEDVSRRPKMSAASIRRVAAEQSRIGRIPCNGEVRGGSRTTSGILPSTLCVECIPAAGGQRDAVGSLVIASRPPAARAQRHRSRRRKMVSGTYSRDGGATVRFRRVREPESRRMRDRRLAIRARHPVVLLARADAEPRAAWWARTPTPTSPRPRLPAVAPPSLEVWRARADLGVAADGTPQREAESPFVGPPAGGTPSSCHTTADERAVALATVRCRGGARSKQSCAVAHTDARYWAEAEVPRRRRSRLPSSQCKRQPAPIWMRESARPVGLHLGGEAPSVVGDGLGS
jgi:hypothetical protein